MFHLKEGDLEAAAGREFVWLVIFENKVVSVFKTREQAIVEAWDFMIEKDIHDRSRVEISSAEIK